jgi:hypothetical protein
LYRFGLRARARGQHDQANIVLDGPPAFSWVSSVRIDDRARAKQVERFVQAARRETLIQDAKGLTVEGAPSDRAFKLGA